MFIGSFAGTKTGYYLTAVHKEGRIVSLRDFADYDERFEKERKNMLALSGLTSNCIQAYIRPEMLNEFYFIHFFYHDGRVTAKVFQHNETNPFCFDTLFKTSCERTRDSIIPLAKELSTSLRLPFSNCVRVVADAFIQVRQYHSSLVTYYFPPEEDKTRLFAPFVYIAKFDFKELYDKALELYRVKRIVFCARSGLHGGVVILRPEFRVLTFEEFKSLLSQG